MSWPQPSSRRGPGVDERPVLRVLPERDVPGESGAEAPALAERATEDAGWAGFGSAVEVLRPPLPRHPISVAALVGLVVVCSAGAAAAMAWIAGLGAVARQLAAVDWSWVGVAAGGVVLAFAGYRFAFDRLVWTGVHWVSWSERLGVVIAGFGAFVPKGGTALDRYVMQVTGRDRRDSDVRLVALQLLEIVPIALAACVAAYCALCTGGRHGAPFGYSVPWAIGPVVGVPVAAWVVHRYRLSFTGERRLSYWAGVTLEGLALLGSLCRRRSGWAAFAGMSLFSAGELLAVWAAMATFGYRMPLVHLVLGYGVGYVVSRRSAPLGGAGVIDIILILALANIGAPLAVVVGGIFTYRFFNLWCPVPASLAALGGVRRLALRASLGGATGWPDESS